MHDLLKYFLLDKVLIAQQFYFGHEEECSIISSEEF